MLTHWFAGAGIFYIGSIIYGFEYTVGWLISGALIGALPDLFSLLYGFRLTKDSHAHRENWSHSILWYPVPVALALVFGGAPLALLALAALLSHPALDCFGLGFGVQIFLPFSSGSLYLRWPLRKIWYSQDEIKAIIVKENDNDWFRHIFLAWPSSRPLIFWTEIVSVLGIIWLLIVCFI